MSLDANVSDTMMDEIARQLGIDAADLKKAGFTFFPLVMPVHLTNLQKQLQPYGGEIKANYTAVTLVNNTAKNQAVTVPANKRWFLWGGFADNADDVARSFKISLFDADDQLIMRLIRSQSLAGPGEIMYPNTEATILQTGHGAYPIVMDAGWYLAFYWAAGGASTGGTSHVTALVTEVEV